MTDYSAAAWIIVSISAILTGATLAWCVRRWKSLPPQPEFVVADPPPKPVMIVFTHHPRTSNPVFQNQHVKGEFDFRAIREPMMSRSVNSPRDLLRLIHEFDIPHVEIVVHTSADLGDDNPFTPEGMRAIFFRNMGIE